MIINTGMRTDIPAFYSEWFMNRIREGYVLVRNPYRQDWITRYELNPDVVDCIAFCTKNPAPMLKHIDELQRFNQYWFVTITPYGKDVEPNVPPKEQVMQDFIALSKNVGVNCIGWRYDPIFIDTDSKRAGECKRLFSSKQLIDFEIQEIEERGCCLTRILTKATWKKEDETITEPLEFGVEYVNQNDEIAPPWRNNGEWQIIPWKVQGLNK